MKDRNEVLEKALKEVGGVSALAEILGITPGAVSQWSRVPAEHAVKIERATGGTVTREELRPDIFGEAAE